MTQENVVRTIADIDSMDTDPHWMRLRDALITLSCTPFHDADAVRKRLLITAAEALDVDRVSLWLFEPGLAGIVCVAIYESGKGITHPEMRLPAAAAPDYFHSLQGLLTLAVADAQVDPRTRQLADDYLKPLGIGAMLDVPVRQFGELIGILCHEHSGSPRQWLMTERVFAAAMGALCSQVMEFEKLRRSDRERQHALFHDQLTGLANRALFLERLESARKDGDAALLVLDVDGFGEFAKAFGPAFGDQLLRETASRLEQGVRRGELAGRLGNDEFALLLLGERGVMDAVQRATDLRGKMQAGMFIDGQDVRVRFSIGLVPSIRHYDSALDVLRDAEIAQNSAARAGRDFVQIFESGMEEPIRRRLELEADIRRAIEAFEFRFHLQPVFSRDGTLHGAEALIRWQHPRRGLLEPAEFLQVAEDSGLLALMQWPLLGDLFEQVARWRATRNPGFVVAINLSSLQLARAEFPDQLVAAAIQAGLPVDAISVEVTENCLLTNQELDISVISRLAASGFSLSLDDFGTGYASITHLVQLPLSTVKIDRSFVSRAVDDPRYGAIIETLIRLAHNFSLAVVAEGIETPAQKRMLSAGECDYLQGFHLGRPMSIAEFESRWLCRARADTGNQP
jgi:diguanylate cyclase (GGDEF)-like protein